MREPSTTTGAGIQRPIGLKLARRAAQYWQPLKQWWRGFFPEHGCKPSAKAVLEWYMSNADSVWGTGVDKPSIKEALAHGNQLGSYFRDYRRRARSKRSGHSYNQSPSSGQEGSRLASATTQSFCIKSSIGLANPSLDRSSSRTGFHHGERSNIDAMHCMRHDVSTYPTSTGIGNPELSMLVATNDANQLATSFSLRNPLDQQVLGNTSLPPVSTNSTLYYSHWPPVRHPWPDIDSQASSSEAQYNTMRIYPQSQLPAVVPLCTFPNQKYGSAEGSLSSTAALGDISSIANAWSGSWLGDSRRSPSDHRGHPMGDNMISPFSTAKAIASDNTGQKRHTIGPSDVDFSTTGSLAHMNSSTGSGVSVSPFTGSRLILRLPEHSRLTLRLSPSLPEQRLARQPEIAQLTHCKEDSAAIMIDMTGKEFEYPTSAPHIDLGIPHDHRTVSAHHLNVGDPLGSCDHHDDDDDDDDLIRQLLELAH